MILTRLLVLTVGLLSILSACGGEQQLDCREARTCLAPDGDSCSGDEECTSGYCGRALLPNDPSPDDILCRQKSSCELDGCERCARFGELGRTDGAPDEAVCIDACFSEEEASCTLCGCPAQSQCNPDSDRCEPTQAALLTNGSVCKEDADCQFSRCRESADNATLGTRLCTTGNEVECTPDTCLGGTCWDSPAYTAAVCLGACEDDADCDGSLGGTFACVELENGARGCRMLCSSPNCGGVSGTTRCDHAQGSDGSVEICPSSPGIP